MQTMSTQRLAWIAPLLLAATATATAAAAQAKPDLDLSTIKSLDCTFSVAAVGRWKGGEPLGEIKTAGVVSVRLEEIDTQDGSARVAGAAEEMVVQSSAFTLHFLDVSRAGRMALTTVFAQETKPGRLKAAHTRSDYVKITMGSFDSEPSIAQYYGDCAPTR
jgi:hypothetical protein